MAQTTIINKFGKLTGWNSVKINLLGRDVEGCSEVDYNDEVEMESVYGAGNMPIGYGEGAYKAKASFTLLNEERLAIIDSLPPGVRLQEIAPFTVIVSYEYENVIYKDIIHNCKFKTNGVSVKQKDMSINHKFDLLISHIDYNVK